MAACNSAGHVVLVTWQYSHSCMHEHMHTWAQTLLEVFLCLFHSRCTGCSCLLPAIFLSPSGSLHACPYPGHTNAPSTQLPSSPHLSSTFTINRPKVRCVLCLQEQISNIIEHWKQVVNEKSHAQPLPKMYTSRPALMCSIKGPEIRSTMLQGHNPIQLTAGKEVTLTGTSDARFEGYSTDTKTVIGITYTDLCKTAKTGDIILVRFPGCNPHFCLYEPSACVD